LCPVVLSVAPRHDLSGDPFARSIDVDGVPRNIMMEIPQWTGLVNVIGYPACVVPIGPTDESLPVGMQIVTSYLRDRESIDLARHLANVISFEPPLTGTRSAVRGDEREPALHVKSAAVPVPPTARRAGQFRLSRMRCA
jgi:hypothetical protein